MERERKRERDRERERQRELTRLHFFLEGPHFDKKDLIFINSIFRKIYNYNNFTID